MVLIARWAAELGKKLGAPRQFFDLLHIAADNCGARLGRRHAGNVLSIEEVSSECCIVMIDRARHFRHDGVEFLNELFHGPMARGRIAGVRIIGDLKPRHELSHTFFDFRDMLPMRQPKIKPKVVHIVETEHVFADSISLSFFRAGKRTPEVDVAVNFSIDLDARLIRTDFVEIVAERFVRASPSNISNGIFEFFRAG